VTIILNYMDVMNSISWAIIFPNKMMVNIYFTKLYFMGVVGKLLIFKCDFLHPATKLLSIRMIRSLMKMHLL